MKKVMRKIISLTALILVLSMLSGCGTVNVLLKAVANPQILDGYIDKEEHLDESRFQDFTDYCKYFYDENGKKLFEESGLYTEVDKGYTVKKYVDDFRQWMEAEDRLDEYDFKTSQITKGDYYNIVDERPDTECYTLYLYDSETNTLYYFCSKW